MSPLRTAAHVAEPARVVGWQGLLEEHAAGRGGALPPAAVGVDGRPRVDQRMERQRALVEGPEHLPVVPEEAALALGADTSSVR